MYAARLKSEVMSAPSASPLGGADLVSDKITVLVAARKNSKYLARFIFSYLANTFGKHQLLVMLNREDTWNRDLVRYFDNSGTEGIEFRYENRKLGRGGLNVYFNDLLKSATGDWIIYFCEDHCITYAGWDHYFLMQISEWKLSPAGIYCLIPKFDNVGAMNQLLSRGYIDTIGNLGSHGNIDSYINDINRALGKKIEEKVVYRFDRETFHDFTHDNPSPLDDIHTKTELSDYGKNLPKFTDHIVADWIERDAAKIRRKFS